MGLLVDFFEVFRADMGIDLGGGQIPVSEHLLDAPEITPAVQEVCGEGMAEGMGAHFLVQGGLPDPFADDPARAAAGQPQAVVVQEKRP